GRRLAGQAAVPGTLLRFLALTREGGLAIPAMLLAGDAVRQGLRLAFPGLAPALDFGQPLPGLGGLAAVGLPGAAGVLGLQAAQFGQPVHLLAIGRDVPVESL